MAFRKDINGLRAIAVIAVVLFHFNPSWMTGGFAGVDVFFVISGFLMTGIIVRGIEKNDFSILKFYVARANRIIPALAVLCMVLLIFGWFYLAPLDYRALGKHTAGSIGFISNIFYKGEAGYFEASSLEKWLLHTWSLSVEWQFYMLYPIFIIAVYKLFSIRIVRPAIVFLTVCGFIISFNITYSDPTSAYYLLPARFWEMTIGGIAYLYPIKASNRQKSILEKIGLLSILGSYFLMSSETSWPGYLAFFPVLGAFLIILSQHENSFFTGNIVFQKIGLWSYSIYLWHWPFVVFIYYFSLNEYFIYLGILLSVFMGFISYKYIESIDFRVNLVGFLSYFKFKPLYFVVCLGIFGSVVHSLNGIDFRGSNKAYSVTEMTERLRANHGLSSLCEDSFKLIPECRTSDEPEILVWGDSYSMHLVSGILASNPEAKIIQLTKSSCGPFFDLTKIGEGSFANECLDFTEKVKSWIAGSESIKYVVMSSPFNYESQHKVRFRNGSERKLIKGEAKKQFEKTLVELERMGVKPVFFSPPPQVGNNIGKCLDKALFFNESSGSCDFKDSLISKSQIDIYSWLSELSAKYRYINLKDYICSGGKCKASLDGYYVYRDSGHLSYEGARVLGENMGFYNLITDSENR